MRAILVGAPVDNGGVIARAALTARVSFGGQPTFAPAAPSKYAFVEHPWPKATSSANSSST